MVHFQRDRDRAAHRRRPVLELLESRDLPSDNGLSAGAAPVAATAYARLPLSFEPNVGQAPPSVRYLARGDGYTVDLTAQGAALQLGTSAIGIRFAGARPHPALTALTPLPGVSNYFVGTDPANWRHDIPTFARIRYENLYRGINLTYYGTQRQLEFDFTVAPGFDPSSIRLAFSGTTGVTLDRTGNLVLRSDSGDVVQQSPVLYQMRGEVRQAVAGHYVLLAAGQVGFQVGAYDRSLPLVIDPVLSYSSYLGNVTGTAVATDASGSAYVIGSSSRKVFLDKLNPAGTALLYSTTLGGSGTAVTTGSAVAVDGNGNAYVTGQTLASDFPTTAPLQAALSGTSDAFVTKLNGSGAVVYSTFLGGSGDDGGQGLAVGRSGEVAVAGFTASTDFPTSAPLQSVKKGGQDAFVARLSAAGTALVYSTYLGGSADDQATAVALDANENVYLTGQTASSDLPATTGALRTTAGGATDAFVAELNTAGSAFAYVTYLGGSGEDQGTAIAVDPNTGAAYVVGRTTSTNFPTVTPLQTANAGAGDAFVAKLTPTGSALAYSTFLGGSGDDRALGLAVDGPGSVTVVGLTGSTNFPTLNAPQSAPGGGKDAFVARLIPAGSALVFATYLGGSGDDQADAVALDQSSNVYVAGTTASTNFPTVTPGLPGNGQQEAFVSKFDPTKASLQFSAASFTGPESGGSVLVTVSRTGGASGAVSVQYATSDGTATAGTDYTATAGTLTWADGDATPKTFTVPLLDDGGPGEPTQTLSVLLSRPTGPAGLGPQASAVVSITEGAGQLQFGSPTFTVDESAGMATITVVRAGDMSGAVTVQYKTGRGSAGAGTDYTAVSGTLSWADGDGARKTFSVPILDDNVVGESDVGVSLTLSSPTGGATIGIPSTANLTIKEDTDSAGQLQLTASTFSAVETDKTANLTVSRKGGSDGIVTVQYATSDGTGKAGVAYTATTGTLSWADGDTASKTIAVPLLDDQLTGEGDETVHVTLSSAAGGATLGTVVTAVVTISEDPEVPVLLFSAPRYSVSETGTTATVTVNRGGEGTGAVSVQYATSDGTARTGLDYTRTSGTLSWAAGDTAAKTIAIPILDDNGAGESTETVTLQLSNPTGGAILGSLSTATLNITEDPDDPANLVQFSATGYQFLESGGAGTIAVTRQGTQGTVTVQYAVQSGTATAGTDFVAASGTLTFKAGETSKAITLTLLDDADDSTVQGNETATVTLSNPTGGAVLGTPATVTIKIVEDDSTVGLTPNQAFVDKLYHDLLHRTADAKGLSYFGGLLDRAQITRGQAAALVMSSPEYRTGVVQHMYQSLLKRSADPAGLSNWVAFLTRGGLAEQMEAQVLGSAEYFNSRGGSTNGGFLAAVYGDILGRPIDASGQAGWGSKLAAGVTRVSVAAGILASSESDTNEVLALYQLALHRAADATGLRVYVGGLQKGLSNELELQYLMASDEYFARN